MTARTFALCASALLLTTLAACSNDEPLPTFGVETVASGLLNPVGLAVLPDGSLLIAEEGSGEDDDSAGVSLLRGNDVTRIVSGLPSGRDSGDLSGVPLVGVGPDGHTIYTTHFGLGGLYTFQLPDAKADNPVLGPADLTLTMTALNRVQLVNPFDIAFSSDGQPVVTDASGNGVAVRTSSGATEFIHRFGELSDPADPSLRIDPVPTGISHYGDEYYVSLTGGCPYPLGSGRVVAIDGARGERVVLDGLNMPIDVAHDKDGTLWILEFTRFDPSKSCFTGEGYERFTGRLGRVVDGRYDVMVDGLDLPTSMAFDLDGSIYVSQLAAGEVIKLTISLDGSSGPAPSTSVPDTQLSFADVAAEVGLDFQHHAFASGRLDDPAAQMGGGVCWIDFDLDGLLDLYFVDYDGANALYRNTPKGFIDVSDGSGANLTVSGMGCVVADFTGDGWSDLVVTADGQDTLLVNDTAGTFQSVPIGTPEWSTGAAATDVDGDGDIDLFVGVYLDLAVTVENPSGAYPQDHPGLLNHLYLNDGSGTFRDVTAAAGLVDARRTLGTIFTDFDRDGDPDLYVANDGETNRLYENRRGSGPLGFTFVDITDAAGTDDSGSGMGVATADYDSDGNTDLMVTNWDRELHALYRGGGDGAFTYSTFRIGYAGFGAGETGWGTSWADFDNDGDLDLFIANGHVPVADLANDAEPLEVFINLGLPLSRFRLASSDVGLHRVGPLHARGSAVADYDNDGDLDVAINNIGGNPVLLRNDSPPGNWIGFTVTPATPGTVVTVTLDDGSTLRRELLAGSSYLSSEDPRLEFGLGDVTEMTSASVTWPDGTVTEIGRLEANRWHSIVGPTSG